MGIGVVRVRFFGPRTHFVGGRSVIAVPAKGNWFRENWDIGHELGHLIRAITTTGLVRGTQISAKRWPMRSRPNSCFRRRT